MLYFSIILRKFSQCEQVIELLRQYFFEKFDIHFEKVSKKEELGVTKRGSGGFGSTGITVIKKVKVAEDDYLAVTAKEVIITVNDEAILHEKVNNKN